MLRKKNIKLNGKKATGNEKLSQGDQMCIRDRKMVEKIKAKVPECQVELYDLDAKDTMREKIDAADILVNGTLLGMKPKEDTTVISDTTMFHEGLVAVSYTHLNTNSYYCEGKEGKIMAVCIVVCMIVGYLFGCIQTGYIVGRVNKIDIRDYGSGNSGTTNTLRTLGKTAAIITFLGDAVKGLVAVNLARYVIMPAFHVEGEAYLRCV